MTPSNHVKPMRSIEPELLDKAIFPIEIGLHRAFRDIGITRSQIEDAVYGQAKTELTRYL